MYPVIFDLKVAKIFLKKGPDADILYQWVQLRDGFNFDTLLNATQLIYSSNRPQLFRYHR